MGAAGSALTDRVQTWEPRLSLFLSLYPDMILVNSYQSTRLQTPLILMLQGPVGPFFRRLHQQFIDRGFRVIKVNFTGGDLLFSPRGDVVNFRGSPAQWTLWLNTFIAEQAPAAIVLFGDCRPYHAEALHLAKKRQVTTWCLEEGYVRPNYVTCERSGNNARSPLRQDDTCVRSGLIAPGRPVRNPFGTTTKYAILHALGQIALASRFHGNVRHRRRTIARECALWGLSLLRKAAFYPSNLLTFRAIVAQRFRNYYVVALQVHDDLNLLRNGNGWTMQHLIDEATRSFARHAPSTHQLLFKVHPLDRGHLPYRKLVAQAARKHGCDARVKVVDDRPIGPMIRNSRGVITVNSTSGLIALEHGKPLMVLGNAVYSTAALQTLPLRHSVELDMFWTRPAVAQSDAVQSFFARMHEESLVNGNFYLAAEGPATADAVADRIHEDFVTACRLELFSARRSSVPRMEEIRHERVAG